MEVKRNAESGSEKSRRMVVGSEKVECRTLTQTHIHIHSHADWQATLQENIRTVVGSRSCAFT